MKPRVLQLFAAGMNCDRELAYAWKAAGAEVKQVHVQTLIDQPNLLEECEVFSIPGGFTYGDDLGAGKILALEVKSSGFESGLIESLIGDCFTKKSAARL